MKVVCTHCGLPFVTGRAEQGRPVFCCSGCAFAFRIKASAGAGSAPAPGYLAALGAGFLLFNQALGALLAHLAGSGSVFTVASLASGSLAWFAILFFQRESGVRRVADRVVAGCLLAGLGWSAASLNPGAALGFNALFATWSLRGLARKMLRGKR
jgi:hypothetical protein